jgi:hypothetical protein
VTIDAALDRWLRLEPLAQHRFSDVCDLVGGAWVDAADYNRIVSASPG